MSQIYQYLPKINPAIIFEAGAHNGSDTQNFCEMFPSSKIYAFEPNKNLFDMYLIPLTYTYPNLNVTNKGLAKESGKIKFYLDENPNGSSGASSLLESESDFLQNHIKIETCIEIECTSLVDFCNQNQIDKIDFIWLDIEGYEYYLLESIQNSLLKNIKYIYLELNYKQFRKNIKKYDDVHKLLIDNSFEQIFLEPNGCDTLGIWQANGLYRNLH